MNLFFSTTITVLLFLAGSAFGEEQSPSSPLDVLKTGYALPQVTNNPTSTMRGQFTAVNFTTLAAGIDGKIEALPVRAGSVLKKGDLIAKFACKREQAEHQIALAKVDVADKNLEINKRLYEYQNVSELELAVSESELEIAKAESRRTETIVAECAVYAPFDSTVTEKAVQAYQYVQQGDPLVQIVGTDLLEVEMILPSIDISQYTPGRRFTILVDETGKTHYAAIDRIVNVIDPVSQRILVIGKLLNKESGLMPGMSGIVSFVET